MSQDHQFAVAPDRCRKQICCVAKAAGNRWRWRLCDWPMTYGSRALGTRLRATFRSSAEHFPISRPQAMPMRFSTSMSSWISNMLSKLNKYSNLQGREQEERMKTWTQASPCMFWPSPGGAASIEQTQGWENAPPPVLMSNYIFSCWLISWNRNTLLLLHLNNRRNCIFWIGSVQQAEYWKPGRDGSSVRSEGSFVLVAGDAAVDDGFLAGVDDDEGKVDDGIGRRGSVRLLFCLSVPLHQVLKCYLLRNKIEQLLKCNDVII